MLKLIITTIVFSSLCFMMVIFAVRVDTSFKEASMRTEWTPRNNLASVFLKPSITTPALKHKFNVVGLTDQKVRILLVPGHEPNTGGSEFGSAIERDMAVALAGELAKFFENDEHYEVIVARGKKAWNPEFEKYFKEQDGAIRLFMESQRSEMSRLMKEGRLSKLSDGVYHNDAPSNQAFHLYGINKWANDHAVDIVLHIHFNDYYRKHREGEYTGLTIYVPEKQYSNAAPTLEIAPYLMGRLTRFFPSSNLSKESKGIVEDQDLIAVGGNNSVDGASMLIEYGYIYEKQFAHEPVRSIVLKELAFQTYLGVQDFFGITSKQNSFRETTLLPYVGGVVAKRSPVSRPEVLRLQAVLSEEGFYPPKGKTKNECPLTGVFGACTRVALEALQREHDIRGEEGVVGEKTAVLLKNSFLD